MTHDPTGLCPSTGPADTEERCDNPMTTELRLEDPRDTLKMIRETLCVASTGLGLLPYDTDRHMERIGRIIREIDRQRPLGSDGKHGDLHTPTCGCEDVCCPPSPAVVLSGQHETEEL